MILFQEDYQTHRHIIDTTTRNGSFLRMYSILKQLGIKNNKFFLVLTQPELQGVDPHSPNLTEDQQLKIAYECKVNPWYFFREVIRIPSAGGQAIRYELNRANLALIWLFLNDIDTFLTMPRQIGKTIGTIGLIMYMMYILGENVNVGLFAKDAKLRQENVDRLKELRNSLPKYLYLSGPNYNTDNQEGLEYKELHNKYITFVAQIDKKSAEGQGRGQSHGFQHWDELAYYNNNYLSYDSAIAATNTAGEQVRKLGIPCANIITTTAGSLSTEEGQYAYQIRSLCVRYTEGFFDRQNKKDLHQFIEGCSENKMVYIEFSWKQLGKDMEWWNRVTRGKNKDVIERDYLNIWSYGGKGSLIPKELLEKLTANILDPLYHENVDGLMMKWFLTEAQLKMPEVINIPLIISTDTSDNVGKDYTTILVMNPADMSVVMTCRCNETNFAYIAKLIVNLLKRFPRSVLIPERNKNGSVLIDFVVEHFAGDHRFQPFKRIYNMYVQNNDEKTPEFHTLDLSSGLVRKNLGFNTTSGEGSRKLLFSSVLMNAVKRNYMRIFDANLIDEIKSLTTRNNRVDHKEGQHDDTLIAYLIASFFVMYGKNHHMYGIKSTEILNVIAEDESVTAFERQRRDSVRARIAVIQSTLDGQISNMLRTALTSELDYLKSTIPEDELSKHTFSMHQVKQEVAKSNVGKVSGSEIINLAQFYY